MSSGTTTLPGNSGLTPKDLAMTMRVAAPGRPGGCVGATATVGQSASETSHRRDVRSPPRPRWRLTGFLASAILVAGCYAAPGIPVVAIPLALSNPFPPLHGAEVGVHAHRFISKLPISRWSSAALFDPGLDVPSPQPRFGTSLRFACACFLCPPASEVDGREIPAALARARRRCRQPDRSWMRSDE